MKKIMLLSHVLLALMALQPGSEPPLPVSTAAWSATRL
jgi:hypothetical protein